MEITELLYLWIFPTLGVMTPLLFIIFVMIIPRSAWVRIGSKFKKNVVFVSIFSDEGYEYTELMKSNLGQGILSGKKYSYIFTPRPTIKVLGRNQNKEVIDLPQDEKANFNQAITHRFFTDTGKPLYLGYVGKSLAVTPKMLKMIEDTNSRVKKGKIKKITLLDPRILKLYLTKTLSPSLIESIKQENERKGLLRRGLTDTISGNLGWIVMLGAVALIAYMIMSGQIDLGGILGT